MAAPSFVGLKATTGTMLGAEKDSFGVRTSAQIKTVRLGPPCAHGRGGSWPAESSLARFERRSAIACIGDRKENAPGRRRHPERS